MTESKGFIQRLQFLRDEINRHNQNYFQFDAPQIPDVDFDALMQELQKLEDSNPSLDRKRVV